MPKAHIPSVCSRTLHILWCMLLALTRPRHQSAIGRRDCTLCLGTIAIRGSACCSSRRSFATRPCHKLIPSHKLSQHATRNMNGQLILVATDDHAVVTYRFRAWHRSSHQLGSSAVLRAGTIQIEGPVGLQRPGCLKMSLPQYTHQLWENDAKP